MGLKKMAVAAAILAPAFGFTSANVASAAPNDAAVVVGQGTINPGIPATGCSSSAPHVTFDGTVVVVGPDAQTGSIHFDGDSTSACASATADSGTGVLSGIASGTVTFSRTGNVVTVSGPSVSFAGRVGPVTAACQFYPGAANPIVTYILTCQAAL
jgi:multidrug efflux pump subunit AcrA (membrane-fusion protein)